ncbi:hypothetical protein AGMMS49990_07270 [Endomicrobiia bacterium]|nr:hypothetical protein AGMMS49990_07270 [Endomicrobiia bacterium]
MKLKQCLSMFVAFALALSSCDKKNASLVNRRTATPKKMEEIKEAQRAKEREAEAQQKAKAKATADAEEKGEGAGTSSSSSSLDLLITNI